MHCLSDTMGTLHPAQHRLRYFHSDILLVLVKFPANPSHRNLSSFPVF